MLHGVLTIVTKPFKGREERKELEFLHCRDLGSWGEGKISLHKLINFR